MMAIQQRTGFLPSQHGFRFANRFPDVPVFKLLGIRVRPSASKGLCGGMIYAALDYYCAGLDIPQTGRLFAEDGTVIPDTEWLLDYIVRRLLSSFNVLDFRNGALNYYRLMSPGYPEAQAADADSDRMPRSWAWTMANVEWPVIKAKLDSGQPVPLGLVCSKLTKRIVLPEIVQAYQRDHQVLAYGYDLDGSLLTIPIYDPNYPCDDSVFLHLDIGDPERPIPVSLMANGKKIREVYCFFHTRYQPVFPPSAKVA